MIQIISGTNRPDSNSLKVAQIVQTLFDAEKVKAEVLDLRKVRLSELDGSQYSKNQHAEIVTEIQKVNKARGLLIVVPEYNGSMPGVLKYFIDHWTYPESFEYRPVAFIGLGGRFGGLRPVEHLQQVFGYRNAFVFPERIFISNVWNILKDNKIQDDMINQLMVRQVKNFAKFINGLESQKLDANSVNASKVKA